jgi:cell division protein FtsB
MSNKFQYIPMGLLVLFTGKLMILNTWSFESAIVLVALAAVTAIFHYTAKNEEVKEIKALISTLAKDREDLKKEVADLRTHVSGLKIGQAMAIKPAARF